MPTTQKLIVIGAGGHARDVIWLAREAKQPFELVGILDDQDSSQGCSFSDVPVVGRVDDWPRFADVSFVVAIGSPRARRRAVEQMERLGSPRFATVVHASVLHSSYVAIGEGAMIGAGCILTTQVTLGRHVILNNGTTAAHDVTAGDFVTVAPRVALSGNVTLESGSEVGTGACVRQGLKIGRGAMVGMGSVVTKDVAPGDVVVGCPARVMKQLSPF